MRRNGRLGVALLLAGAVIGATVVPRVATAVGTLVTIQDGTSTRKAQVTRANQLRVAEAAPTTFRVLTTSSADANCKPLAPVPQDRGFVVKSLVLNVLVPGSGLQLLTVYPNGTCTGTELMAAPTSVVGNHSIQIEPGFGVAPGRRLSMRLISQGGVAAVHVFGYLVPASDVPATTPICC